jgi:hypothetical protein
MTSYVTFQIFSSVELAKGLTDLLDSNHIPYHVEDTSAEAILMPTSSPLPEIRVQLFQEDFERANSLLESIAIANLAHIRPDHYLLEFSDAELIEILEKPDEWNKNDVVLAQKLLKDRGQEVNPELVNELQKIRLAALATPDNVPRNRILNGYLLAIFGSPIGFLLGWDLLSRKKNLPDGRRVFAYITDDRKHGNRILILGALLTMGWAIFFLRRYHFI